MTRFIRPTFSTLLARLTALGFGLALAAAPSTTAHAEGLAAAVWPASQAAAQSAACVQLLVGAGYAAKMRVVSGEWARIQMARPISPPSCA